LEPGEEPWYHQGDYVPQRYEAETAEESDREALRKGSLRGAGSAIAADGPPPARRLAGVSDIAETIINSLLPDDEDERRELIDGNYQLKSDIETFEHVTDKVIQPEDDLPLLGDEVELEDIERSH
jgi:hypothetical protein